MILNELMIENMQVLPFPVAEGKAPAAKKDNNGLLFNDVLNNTVKVRENAVKIPDSMKSYKQVKESMQDDANKPRPKTFREIENGLGHSSSKPVVGCKKRNEAETLIKPENEDKKIQSDGSNTDIVINCFTQVLGISTDELKTLLQSADITVEEFSKMNGINEIAGKLSHVLGFNGEQQKNLAGLLELAKAQIDASTADQNAGLTSSGMKEVKTVQTAQAMQTSQTMQSEDSINAATEKGIPAPEMKIVKSDSLRELTDLTAIAAKLKLKLNELSEQLTDGKDEPVKAISAEIAPVIKNAAEESGAVEKQITTGSNAGNTVIHMDKPENNTSGRQNDKESAEGKGKSREAETEVKPVVEAPASAVVKNGQVEAVPAVVNQVQKMEPAAEVRQLEIKSPIPAREVISQVIEKAKVILTGDKSEMVMDLKPDSLGKLSLKVVTEHGIVMAKFVAESQQVKQVLETNMQTLKDSLEKQGLNIQGFSVSVRQDSHNGYNAQSEQDGGRRLTASKTAPVGASMYKAAEDTAGIHRSNPFYRSDNTINLTA